MKRQEHALAAHLKVSTTLKARLRTASLDDVDRLEVEEARLHRIIDRDNQTDHPAIAATFDAARARGLGKMAAYGEAASRHGCSVSNVRRAVANRKKRTRPIAQTT